MTKRTWYLLLAMWLLAIFAPLAQCESSSRFQQQVTRWGKVLDYGQKELLFAAQVDWDYMMKSEKQPVFGWSYYDKQTGAFMIFALSDKGLDTAADLFKVRHLTAHEKAVVQQDTIVHEMLHGWGAPQSAENLVNAVTAVIRHGRFDREGVPVYFIKGAIAWWDSQTKAEEQQPAPLDPNILQFLKDQGVPVTVVPEN